MSLCRICDRREATTYMPHTRRPCCEKCLADVVKILGEIKTAHARQFLNLEDALKRHPAGKGPKYEYDRLHGRHTDLRID